MIVGGRSSKVTSVRRFVSVVLRQIFLDRVALFFVVVLPIVVIVIIGVTFGEAGSIDIGMVRDQESPTATAVRAALEDGHEVRVKLYDTAEDMRAAVRRRLISAGVVFPADIEAQVVAGTPRVDFVVVEQAQDAEVARDVVVPALAKVLAPTDAARFVATHTSVSYPEALDAATAAQATLSAVQVEQIDIGVAPANATNRFSRTAPQNLVLFVFVNSLAGGAVLVRMRRTGVLRRVLAGPISAGDIVVGVVAAWFVVSLLQSVLIVAVGGLGFGVDWGDPVGASALVAVFALVGSGAGLVVGALGGNEDRVSAISPPIGITIGALGGCMVPLEIFPPAMLVVARVTPHYWANRAWQTLVFDGGGLRSIALPLVVLLGFAVLFLAIATVSLRRALVRAG